MAESSRREPETSALAFTARVLTDTGGLESRSLVALLYFLDRRGLTPELRDFRYIPFRGARSASLDRVYGVLWDRLAASFADDGTIQPSDRLGEIVAEHPLTERAQRALDVMLAEVPWRAPSDAAMCATVSLLRRMHSNGSDEASVDTAQLVETVREELPDSTLSGDDVDRILAVVQAA